MPKRKPKPAGWKAFDKLARGLAQVPKEEVETKIAADKAAQKIIRRFISEPSK